MLGNLDNKTAAERSAAVLFSSLAGSGYCGNSLINKSLLKILISLIDLSIALQFMLYIR